MSISQWCARRNSFTIGENSVVYQSAPVVDLCRRLFPVVNVVLLPVEGSFAEHPLASPWTRFLNRLIQTIIQLFGSVYRNWFQCLPRRLTLEWLFHSINSITTRAKIWLLANSPHWLTRRDVTPIRTLIGRHRCHSNNISLRFISVLQCRQIFNSVDVAIAIAIYTACLHACRKAN